MPKLDLAALPETATTGYPPPYDALVAGRRQRRVDAGLTDFGANLTTLAPGAMSSLRHWHSAGDELVVLLAGEAVLIDDGGETLLGPGDVATFAKGEANGHHLVNRGPGDAVLLAVGVDHADDQVTYPDADLFWSAPTGYIPASAMGGS